jgi:hypothetical protein
MNRHLGITFLALVACMTFAAGNAAASAEEDLQTVFRNFHKAVLATDLDEMLKWSVKSRSDAFAKASAAERDGAMAFTAKSTPKAYRVTGSIVEASGRDATLYLIADVTDKGNAETMYGSVVFEKEGGAWKVAAAGWSRVQSPAAARQGAAEKPAAAEPAAPVARPRPARSRSDAAATKPAAPILQQRQSPCVYKSVMTDEDIALCR